MKVELISYSQCPSGKFNLEELIAYAARVSNPSNQNNTKTSKKLLAYLQKHKHFSPFEMASVCLEIVTTRDIARQILRHRSFSFQEFSQRYADPTQSLSFVLKEARLQDSKNRQNSIETADESLHNEWAKKQASVVGAAQEAYNWAISNGIAKEQARGVLPEGLMESRLYMNGTVRSWMHYIALRTGNGTQKEHVEVAQDCAKVLAEILPNLFLDGSLSL